MRFTTANARFTETDTVANAREAVRKITADFTGASPKLIVFFAATNYDPDTLAQGMHAAFPQALTFGCTSSGEAVDDRMLRNSVTAMAFSAEVFDHCGMALVLRDGPAAEGDGIFASVDAAMNHIGAGADDTLLDLDYRKYVGFMLVDAISRFSERVLERVGELTDVMYIGGVAGDDYKFTGKTRVFYQGKAYENAAVVGLWKPRDGFALLKTQAADMIGKTFTVTRADDNVVWELDGRDAAVVYAEAIGIPPEKTRDMSIYDFDCNAPALLVDGEPFLRAIIEQVDGKGLRMFATAREGQRLSITRVGDLAATTRTALEEKTRESGPFAAILHVNCASRCTAIEKQCGREQFGSLFRGIPSVSFSSYGEIYVGLVAMTSTMILFK